MMTELQWVDWLTAQITEFARSYPQFNLDAEAARRRLARYIASKIDGQDDAPIWAALTSQCCGAKQIPELDYCPACREHTVWQTDEDEIAHIEHMEAEASTTKEGPTNMADITGHTPGPWIIDHERIGPPGEPVALLCDAHAPESGTVVEWPRFGEVAVDDAENEANARLIASAPALLAALMQIMDFEGGEPGSYNDPDTQERADEIWQYARNAIAKAKGGA